MERRLARIAVVGTLALALAGLGAPAAAGAATISPIDQRYQSDRVAAAELGSPTGAEYSVAGGRERDYAKGSMFWSSTTGARYVTRLLPKYRSLGGPGKVGFPVADEVGQWASNHSEVAREVTLGKGSIEWVYGWGLQPSAPHFLPTSIYGVYWAQGGYYDIGAPQTDAVAVPGNAVMVDFDNAQIYSGPTTGTHSVRTAVEDEYLAKGGPTGFLGLPTSDVRVLGSPVLLGVSQSFQGGTVYFQFSGTTGAHEVHGGIRSRYNAEGGTSGRLGFPVSDELWAPYGRKQRFEHGEIRWAASTNKTSVVMYP